ncbi:MAG: hypothetical protein J6P56_01800, partial [Bacteroidales bacterium]|nr:hypothetical protein [Bacteroidales bacterium]
MLLLLGTVSKESSEDVFAIATLNGGNTWNKVELTDIENNALVNELGIGFTSAEEPILFYSVQKYQNNFDTAETDAANIIQNKKPSSTLTGLQSVMLGQNDPRVTDTQTDLYVKARKANQRVKI